MKALAVGRGGPAPAETMEGVEEEPRPRALSMTDKEFASMGTVTTTCVVPWQKDRRGGLGRRNEKRREENEKLAPDRLDGPEQPVWEEQERRPLFGWCLTSVPL